MYSIYQDREELEDDLYREDEGDSDGSEASSELEFRLYSQLHYSSNPGEMEEQGDEDEEEKEHDLKLQDSQQQEVTEKAADESKPLSPVNGKLQQHPVKKRKKMKEAKQKTRKSDPKGQKSSSLSFEEVIVIDSSPEVISISEEDSSTDDEGICALKGHGLPRLQTSTPGQQGTQKRKSSGGVPVTVDSSSSETDSEESESKSESDSSDSSDSDGLENWMILGREVQDGDQSISLNLEGGRDNSTDAEERAEGGSWVVSDKDKEAQIYNKDKGARIGVQRVSNRYYTNKNVQCRNCNKTGHLSKNCPEPKKLLPCFLCGTPGHLASECPNKHCSNCGLPGHVYDSCSERAYWHKQCHRCSMTGHFFDACPEIWRQYHVTTTSGPPAKWPGGTSSRSACCYNCSRKGHFGHACTQRRMFKAVYPSTQFINQYDTVKEMNRRQHRITLKVKELKANGYLPAPSQTPVTPKPPKKKQKTSHHTNSHQPNHAAHPVPNNHRASHIFFDDHTDFSAATPSMSTFKKCKQENTGSVKPWKPKRPVPKSRDPLPPAKVRLDEADDFPRGGGTGENMEEKKRRRRMKKMKQVPFLPSDGHKDRRPDHLSWTAKGKKHGPESRQQKGEKKKKRKNQGCRFANKKPGAEMYPTDENLFTIKQRKRHRERRTV